MQSYSLKSENITFPQMTSKADKNLARFAIFLSTDRKVKLPIDIPSNPMTVPIVLEVEHKFSEFSESFSQGNLVNH